MNERLVSIEINIEDAADPVEAGRRGLEAIAGLIEYGAVYVAVDGVNLRYKVADDGQWAAVCEGCGATGARHDVGAWLYCDACEEAARVARGEALGEER